MVPTIEALGRAEALSTALRDPAPSWITLPPASAEIPDTLRTALGSFDAGTRPAGQAASAWLRDQALRAHPISRTRLLVAEGKIMGYYSLASAQVELRQSHRRQFAAGDGVPMVPAALVTWIAKDCRADVEGKHLLMHAVATARRVDALQATSVLVVDPYDDDTAQMWRDRFGFRPSAGQAGPRRLWLPLSVESLPSDSGRDDRDRRGIRRPRRGRSAPANLSGPQ